MNEAPVPRIKEVRKRVGMTQETLAEKLGVTKRTVSNIENGRTLPNLGTVFMIAAILGVAWFALYTNTKGGKNNGSEIAESGTND